MPQLDHTTFISQLFWLIVIFSCLYLMALKYILPTIGQVLKVRKKMLIRAGQMLSVYENEQSVAQKRDEEIYNQTFIESRTLLVNVTITSAQWLDKSLNQVNHSNLSRLNQAYLNSLSNVSAVEWSLKNIIKTE